MAKKKKSSETVAAKKKLKTHLKNHLGKNSRYFHPTEAMAWYWWRVINKAAFKNELPYPSEIAIKNLRGAWGTCLGKTRTNECIICISTNIKSRKLFIATIAHEMVHQWQFHFGKGTLDHGLSYKDWDRYFRSHFGIIL